MRRQEKKTAANAAGNTNKYEQIPWIEKRAVWIIAFLVIAAYISTLKFGYISLDDAKIILDNQDKISDVSSIPESFVSEYGFNQGTPYYRPMVNISFIANALVGGREPAIYHFTNVLLHFGCCWLLYLLFTTLSTDKTLALLAAGILAVHPLFTNAVSWIAGRNDLLAALFALASFLFMVRYIELNRKLYLWFHFALLLLAMFSKEVAVVLPLCCVLFVLLFGNRQGIRKYLPVLSIGWVAAIGIFMGLRLSVIKTSGVIYGFEAFRASFPALPETIMKFLLPHVYSPLPGFSATFTIIGFILIFALVFAPFILPGVERKKYYWGLAWFTSMLLPGLFVILSDQQERIDFLDCRVYLPAAGLMYALIQLVPAAWITMLKTKPLRLLVVAVPLIALTYINSNFYANPKAFAERLIEADTHSAFAYRKIADYYYTNSDYPASVRYLTKAIDLAPGSIPLYKNLALNYSRMNQYSEAEATLEKAARLNNTDWEIFMGLAKLHFIRRQYDKAFNDLSAIWALGKNPASLGALYNDLLKIFRELDPGKAAILYSNLRKLENS
ncbi:MAG: glycosyltransferase family 39 protein [Ignavibacteria bacterium]|nr:glycosyltransferase family 39 protein [Ignavibacteria bacterium]